MAGPRLVVVRPRAQALAWVEALRTLGVDAQALPLIEIEAAPEPARVAAAFAEAARLSDDIDRAADVRPESGADTDTCIDDSIRPLLVFVSPNAVDGFFAAARADAWPAQAWAGATGPGTVAALREAGVPARRIVAPPAEAAQFDSEALWSRLAAWRWDARPVWLVRGNGGRDWLGQRLRERGADVRVVQSYTRAAPAPTGAERAVLAQALDAPGGHVWMFSSSEAVDNLVALAPSASWREARAFATHPRIAERLRVAGFGEVVEVGAAPAAVAAALRELERGPR